MADVVKALLAAPVNAVLLVAGLAFLAVAIFRRVTDKLDAGPKGRLFAGVLGIVLIGISLYLSVGGKNPENATPPAAAATEAATQPDGGFPVALPAGQVVKQEDRTYTILKIALDRHEIDQLALTFTVRMTNQSSYPANF
jgi:Co/Zn/Cd efflux system component